MSSSGSGSLDFSQIPLENPPAGVIPNFDNPPSIIWHLTLISILGVVLTILCLVLRLYTRFVLIGRGGGFEDGFLVVAAILGIANCVLGNEMGKVGLGRHAWDVPMSHLPRFLLFDFITTINYVLGLLFVKLAILGFLYRLNPQKTFRYVIWGLTCIIVVYSTAALLSLILRCHPVSDQWNVLQSGEPHCRAKEFSWFVATGVLNIVTDFVMLCLPVPMLWGIMLPKRQKVGLVLILMTGSMVGFLSIARLILLVPALTSHDSTYAFVRVGILSHLESQIAIVCACLPTLKPLFKQHFKGFLIHETNKRDKSAYAQFSKSNKNVVSTVDEHGKIHLTSIRRETKIEITV